MLLTLPMYYVLVFPCYLSVAHYYSLLSLSQSAVYTVYIMFWPVQYVRAISSHRIGCVQYNIETEKYIQGAIK